MLESILLGILEGATEFLPISSTAHLILLSSILGKDLTSIYLKSFIISIQLGAILAVVFYYFKDFIKYENIKLLVISVLPTITLALLFEKVIGRAMELPLLIACNLILGGIIIILVENKYRLITTPKQHTINYKDGAIFGLVQSLAMIPGVSRSGAIIIYGLYKNFERETVAKFSFLLAVPTMSAATAYIFLKNYKSIFSEGNFSILMLGFIFAFLTALLVVKYAIPFIRKYSFKPFAYYRIILGMLVILFLQ